MFIRIIDLESTGAEPPEHAPCEVGWVDLIATLTEPAPTGWVLDHQSFRSILCNPSRPIPPETSAIHHIIDEDVKGAPFWPAALAEAGGAGGLLAPPVFAAHGAKFERQFLTPEITGAAQWICSYKCALRLWPDAPGHSNQCLRYWLKPAGLDRDIAAKTHRALPDAYVTSFLLREMLLLAPLADLIEWSSKPALLHRVPFGENRGKLWSEIDEGLLNWVLRRDMGEDINFTAQTEHDRREAEWRKQQAANSGDLFPEGYDGRRG